ncbi:MAG: AI-2E family transporter [Rhizobiales bacterium]|nr:AI-2E family transporter [Hyphomicrobiales bacterium]NRB12979.1 AI-2E family transporter [Hyphomicrobiales bacterium]
MTLKQHSIFWAIAIIVFLLFLNIFASIMLPFVAGMAIAYFLDPMADWLEDKGFNRIMATTVIMSLFSLVIIAALLLIVPLMLNQLNQLLIELPSYVDSLTRFAETTGQKWFGDIYAKYIDTGAAESGISGQVGTIVGKLASIGTTLIATIWSGGMAVFAFLSLLIVTPVVAFYLLNDWDRMLAVISSWVPLNHKATVVSLSQEMSQVLAGFIRGQGSVCIILAVYYAVSLSLAGLNFGLVIGIIAGIISFIPYVGAVIGLVLSVGLALVQFWPDYFLIGIVAVIFVVGQFLEGNILTPRLVGRHIGLHPVWLMFALFAFGSLFGFVGLLLAVPVAAMMGVLMRFGLRQYLKSPVYLGTGQQELDFATDESQPTDATIDDKQIEAQQPDDKPQD